MEIPPISDEAIEPSRGDLLAQVQQRRLDDFVASERTKLAAVAGDYVAWMAYPPSGLRGSNECSGYL